MSVFKCKMCGGTIEFNPGDTIGECDSCGTKQTLPRLDDDRRANLYDRANHFRRNNEFDKAAGLFEQILNEDPSDAEAYWSLVLCRYGIEYVEDPATHKRVPTVNRTQFTSIFDDEDYKSAIMHADGYQRVIYEEEATAINEIQKGILEISAKEKPFDVFICYKETDPNGRRTQDSVLANDLYHQLTNEGFKVFFSRITLEDKLGTAYEPYIFAALNSAKVMVVLGTKPEYFNAVWVKNEWSRYLSLVKQSGGKKVLIPAYRDMDPYDLPEEFSHLQAQDMSKLGFMQDLIRGIKKIVKTDAPKETSREKVPTTSTVSVAPLLRRAFMFLEDGNWQSADEYCEKVLDQDPENAQAYLGKLMAELCVSDQEDFLYLDEPFDDSNNYQKAVRFGDEKLSSLLNGYIAHINERNENDRLTGIYNNAVTVMKSADSESSYKAAIEMFNTISGWKDADEQIYACQRKIEEIKAKEEAERLERERQAEERRIAAEMAAKKRKRTIAIVTPIVVTCIAFVILLVKVIIPNGKYNAAVKLYNAGQYEDAITAFNALNGYRDSSEQITKCETAIKDAKYNAAAELYNAGQYEDAVTAFKALNGYKDSSEQITKCEAAIKDAKYNAAVELIEKGDIINAYESLIALNEYKDSAQKANDIFSQYKTEKRKNATVGDIIFFGSYEQDNNSSNGKEDVEWIVLRKEGKKALLISKYALDCQQYNTSDTSVTWETCSLRKWLNGTFLNAAFSENERAMIPSVAVSADKNPSYSTSPGNSTMDQVFLLSIKEVNKYFSSDSARQCQGTAWCYAQGALKASNGNCWWWLRSPGRYSNGAAYVDPDGSVDHSGAYVYGDECAVWPALWINLGS